MKGRKDERMKEERGGRENEWRREYNKYQRLRRILIHRQKMNKINKSVYKYFVRFYYLIKQVRSDFFLILVILGGLWAKKKEGLYGHFNDSKVAKVALAILK